MERVLKVEGHDGLVRDPSTLAIINTNKSEYEQHMLRKKLLADKKNEAAKQQEEMNTIKSELLELKSMVAELLSKGK